MSNKQCHCSQCIRFVLKEVQSYQFDVIDTGESNQKPKYCIAENFRGRKLSWILRFCGYSWKFFPWNSGVWRPLAWQQRAIRESFLCENCIFHQFAKVFSLESFPLYGMSWSPTCITDRQGVKLVNVVLICPKQCILQQYLWVHFTLLKGVHPGVLNAVCWLPTFPGIELEMVNLYGIVSHQKAGLVPMQLTIYKGV